MIHRSAWLVGVALSLVIPATQARAGTPSAAAKVSTAAKAAAKPALPALLVEVEAKYHQASTMSARFTQVTESAVMKQKKTSSGLILAKRPDKVRWETTSPDPNILVSDGKTFWFYTPPFDQGERGQVIIRRTGEVQSKLANALLSGSFSSVKDVKITQTGPSSFTLSPKPKTAGTVKKAEIEIDPAKKLIEKVTLVHTDGNSSAITLSGIELGKSLSDDEFHFKAPPNTDVVE